MIEYLIWGSNFFGYRIVKLVLNDIFISMVKEAEFDKFDLVYIFSEGKLNENFRLVDIKLTFEKLTTYRCLDDNICLFNPKKHTYN